MTSIRDLFNGARDNDDSVETMIAALDVASYSAGYELSEYASLLEAMAQAIADRAIQILEEADSK